VDAPSLVVTAVVGMPEVQDGDDLAALLARCLAEQGLSLEPGDVVVVSSKVVSKALGLRSTAPRAKVVAAQTRRVVAERETADGRTQVVESAAGPVMAAAGVDASNTGAVDGVLILPKDPDGAAADLRAGLLAASGLPPSTPLGVVVSDTAGRPWRAGQVDFALGAAGLSVLEDLRGSVDADGRPLAVTARALADELAAAADLVKGKASGLPAALVRGAGVALGVGVLRVGTRGDEVERSEGAAALVRTGATDWFGYGTAEAVRASLGVEPGSLAAARVGLPAAGREVAHVRAARSAAVALDGLPEASAHVQGETLHVAAPDPFTLGLAVARLQVALWGEHLRVTETAVSGTSATLRLGGPGSG
jgi:coenzyme F420-0:L-glutamate ligase